jgi:hypothetical protein
MHFVKLGSGEGSGAAEQSRAEQSSNGLRLTGEESQRHWTGGDDDSERRWLDSIILRAAESTRVKDILE